MNYIYIILKYNIKKRDLLQNFEKFTDSSRKGDMSLNENKCLNSLDDEKTFEENENNINNQLVNIKFNIMSPNGKKNKKKTVLISTTNSKLLTDLLNCDDVNNLGFELTIYKPVLKYLIGYGREMDRPPKPKPTNPLIPLNKILGRDHIYLKSIYKGSAKEIYGKIQSCIENAEYFQMTNIILKISVIISYLKMNNKDFDELYRNEEKST